MNKASAWAANLAGIIQNGSKLLVHTIKLFALMLSCSVCILSCALPPAATGMFGTLYDYAKLGSIFLNVRHQPPHTVPAV